MEITIEQKMKYLVRRETDLKDCQNAIISQDLSVLKRVAHQIKGNAITFGFDHLSEIAEELEDQVNQSNWPRIKLLVEQFQEFLLTTKNI